MTNIIIGISIICATAVAVILGVHVLDALFWRDLDEDAGIKRGQDDDTSPDA